jgi:hypothetical protein
MATSVPLPALRPYQVAIVPERLESCIRRLEPADRALLDLSLNRGIADAAMATILKTDPMRLAWKRARAIERVASRLGMNDPADLTAVRTALIDLPSRAWLPLELQPAPAPPVLMPPEPPGAEPVVRRVVFPRTAEALAGAERRADARPAASRQPAQTLARREASLGSTYGGSLGRTAAPTRRAASSLIGGLSERAKRAYPREAMTTHAKQAAGALLVGVAAFAVGRRR